MVIRVSHSLAHRFGESSAPVPVVRELVHGCRRRREQDDIALPCHRRGQPHRLRHHLTSLGGNDLEHRDGRRVSRKTLNHGLTVDADHHNAPQASGVPLDERPNIRALEQSPDDPDHGLECGEGCRGRMRIRGLRVIHPQHTLREAHRLRAVVVDAEGGKRGAHGGSVHAGRAGQRGGREHVLGEVGCSEPRLEQFAVGREFDRLRGAGRRRRRGRSRDPRRGRGHRDRGCRVRSRRRCSPRSRRHPRPCGGWSGRPGCRPRRRGCSRRRWPSHPHMLRATRASRGGRPRCSGRPPRGERPPLGRCAASSAG